MEGIQAVIMKDSKNRGDRFEHKYHLEISFSLPPSRQALFSEVALLALLPSLAQPVSTMLTPPHFSHVERFTHLLLTYCLSFL